MTGEETDVNPGQRLLDDGITQAVAVIKADEDRRIVRLDHTEHTVGLAPERRVHKIVRRGKGDVLLIEYDVLEYALHIFAVYTVGAVHIHIGDGCRPVAYLKVRQIKAFLFQGLDHPAAIVVAASGADDRGWYAELAQIDAGVHHIAGRVAPIERLSVDETIDVNAVVSDHGSLHCKRLLDR